VRGKLGKRVRRLSSKEQSRAFMTTAARACLANTGEKGRARTDIKRRAGRGMCLIRFGLPRRRSSTSSSSCAAAGQQRLLASSSRAR